MVTTRTASSFTRQWPLHAALLRGDAAGARALCASQGLVAAAGPGGITPLHIAALTNAAEMASDLTAAGADVHAMLTHSATNLEVARWLGAARVGRHALLQLTAGTTPLVLAARLNHRECAAVLMDAAADLASLAHSTITFITCPWLFTMLVERCKLDQFTVRGSIQLQELLRCALSAHLPDAFLELLEHAAAKSVCLAPAHAAQLAAVALRQHGPGYERLVRRLLQAGADPSSVVHGQALAEIATLYGCRDSLEVLLRAGAAVTPQLVSAALQRWEQPVMLETLLTAGDLGGAPWASTPFWWHWGVRVYNCPVLMLLQKGAKRATRAFPPALSRAYLLMAEMMAAAGLRPTVYRNVKVLYDGPPAEVFNPLEERREEFELDGVNRNLWLALQPEGWSPATHHRYPPQLKEAYLQVALMVARGSKARTALLDEPGGWWRRLLQWKRQRTGGRCEVGCLMLAGLPCELLQHILHLAARPVSAWVHS